MNGIIVITSYEHRCCAPTAAYPVVRARASENEAQGYLQWALTQGDPILTAPVRYCPQCGDALPETPRTAVERALGDL